MPKKLFKNAICDLYVIVSVVTGIVLLLLTFLFRVNPVEGSVVNEAITDTFIEIVLFITTMPAYIAALFISFFTFDLLFYPLAFLFQIIIFALLGLLLRLAHRGIKRCLHPRPPKTP